MQPIGIDERMPLSRDDFDILQPNAAQLTGNKVGSLLNIGFVLFKRADAGDAEKIFQFV